MTFIPDSRKPTHVQNVYIPQLRNGELDPHLAVRGFKAPQNPEEFRSMLEREVLEAAKKEGLSALQLTQLVEDLLSQENPHLYEASLERLVEELMFLPEVHQSVQKYQFPAKRQASLNEKQEAKDYLEERSLPILLEHVL